MGTRGFGEHKHKPVVRDDVHYLSLPSEPAQLADAGRLPLTPYSRRLAKHQVMSRVRRMRRDQLSD